MSDIARFFCVDGEFADHRRPPRIPTLYLFQHVAGHGRGSRCPATAVLDVINRVEIDAPGVEASTIGNIQLEGVLPGGRIVRTRPTGEVFTWSDRWDLWRLPDLQKVMPGRPLRTLLSFQ